jgi:hypothetical protein
MEPVMKNDGLFDYDGFQVTLRDAKAHRAEYLRQQTRETAGAVRWRGLGAVAASIIALLVGHSINTHSGPGQAPDHSTVSRD